MKIGATGGILGPQYDLVKKCGYDYFETAMSSIAGYTEEQMAEALERVKTVGLPVSNTNGLLSGEIHLTGPEATSDEELTAYLERAFSRAEKLGVKTAVWGSGAGRKIPEGFDLDLAHRQLLNAGRIIGDTAAKYGITVVIEPLCKRETNVFNTVTESIEFMKELNHPAVKVLADSYHMRAESEPFSHVAENIADILHTHIAEAIEGSYDLRVTPDRKDENNIKAFVDTLKACGYEGGISVEAGKRTEDYEYDLTEAARALRQWINE